MPSVLDTNILIRFFTEDNKQMALKAERLIKQSKKNELILPDVIITEIIWVLESYYELPKEQIVKKLEAMLGLEKFKINRKIFRETITFYQNNNIPFTDAYLLAYSNVKEPKSTIYTFDKKLQKVKPNVLNP